MFRSAAALGILVLMAGIAQADSSSINSVASLANPLDNADGGARASAMGSAFVGVADDSSALLWNPSGLAGLENTELSLNHNSWLDGIIQETAVVAVPEGNLGTFGFSANYVNYGSFQGYDDTGLQTANYSVDNYGIGVGWGKEIIPTLSAGIGVNAGVETVDTTNYSVVSGNLGLLWRPIPYLRVGGDYSNLGTDIAGYPLESDLRLGASYDFDFVPANQLLLAASCDVEQAGENTLQVGAEDLISSCLALRAGYNASLTENDLNGDFGWSLGVGVRCRGFSLDYAYIPYGDLGAAQKVSLNYEFGQESMHHSNGG
jgi:hypothetical protein